MAFSPLPIVDFNRNPLDVSPLTDAINNRTNVQFKRNALDMDQQRLDMAKGQDARAAELHPIQLKAANQQLSQSAAAEGRQAAMHPLQVSRAQQEVSAGQDEATKRKAGIYAGFIEEKFINPSAPVDPATKSANWLKVLNGPLKDMAHLNDPEIGPLLRDHEMGPRMVLNIARGYQDPLARKKLEAEVGKLEADAIESKAKAAALGNKATGYDNLNQYANTAEGMRKEFQALPNVKGYEQARGAADRLSRLVQSSKEGKFGTGAGDIAMVFNFMKTLDPESIVMPGEAATARNAPGVTENFRNYYNYLLSGQFLTPATRNDFLTTVNSELESRKGIALQEAKRYRGLARGVQVNPDHIVPRMFAGVDLDGDGRPDQPSPQLGQPQSVQARSQTGQSVSIPAAAVQFLIQNGDEATVRAFEQKYGVPARQFLNQQVD